MTKNFLTVSDDLYKLQYPKILTGIVIGLVYAFSLYSLLYILRETFRIISVTEYYDLWILSDKEVWFYNFVFALIAVIFGQSVTFSFWFDTPGKLFSARKIKDLMIVHDQRGFNWYFLLWFTKLGIIYGLFFGITCHCFTSFSLFPEYNFLFILMAFVLFLSSWTTLRARRKKDGLKLMIISLSLILCISLIFSKINLIDYNSINNNILKKNIQYTYNLHLVESDSCVPMFRKSDIENIYVVLPKSKHEDIMPLIVSGNDVFKIDQLQSLLKKFIQNNSHNSLIVYRFFIDNDVKFSHIIKLNKVLSNLKFYKTYYAVMPMTDTRLGLAYQDMVLKGNLSFNDTLSVLDSENISFQQYLRITGR